MTYLVFFPQYLLWPICSRGFFFFYKGIGSKISKTGISVSAFLANVVLVFDFELPRLICVIKPILLIPILPEFVTFYIIWHMS